MRRTMGRVGSLLIAAAQLALLASCADRSLADRQDSPSPPLLNGASAPEGDPRSGSRLAPAVMSPSEPAPQDWVPTAGEIERAIKLSAAMAAKALTTFGADASPASVALGAGIPLSESVVELVQEATSSRGRVIYPQLVGLTASRAAVTVLVEQSLDPADAPPTSRTRSLDVRLRREAGEWRPEALLSHGGPLTGRPPALPGDAAAVLDHPRIHLPDSARGDIHRGAVDVELLRLLAGLAESYELHVLTFVSGRPRFVFGTDRLSNHARGRAVDIYAVDEVPVVEQREPGSAAHRLARDLFTSGLPELGAPWAFDGFGGRSFTDVVHQDHLHISVGP
jgi:hypothetical protein